MGRKLKYWGWGYEGTSLNPDEIKNLLKSLAEFDITGSEKGQFPTIDSISLDMNRLNLPKSLENICTTDKYERILHTFGQSQPDSLRTFLGDFKNAPDIIAYPKNERDITNLFEWCGEVNAAVIPYGAGSSVVGGVTSDIKGDYNGTVTVDLSLLNKVLEVDSKSQAARIQGGTRGPELEAALKPKGFTLRHFPQSFEHSTLGGWIATRSGGHFATLYTHIDDLVQNVTMVTPAGKIESLRVPGSGAGPSPDRLMLGSEGALGIISEAWVRLQRKPIFKATAGFLFASFFKASQAVRAISQAGLYPANVRIVDNVELKINSAGDSSSTLMVVSFENSDHPVDAWISRAEQCCLDYGGNIDVNWRNNPTANQESLVGAWRAAFIRMPYNREELTPRGIISDTFETAITWDRFESFYENVKSATEQAILETTGKKGAVSCRFSHAYPDGPAPYFAFHANSAPNRMMEDWLAIKSAASDAIIKNGGTITHHHAVGRDHSHWYKQQRPPLFGNVLRTTKEHLDPQGILNPGVIIS